MVKSMSLVSPSDVLAHDAWNEEPEPESSTALVPASPLTVSAFDAETFQANLEKIQMWTSYTGPIPSQLTEIYNVPTVLKGMVIQELTNIDEDGVELRWTDIRFKTADDKIISASGKAARQFAALLAEHLGQGDWPVSIKILVKTRPLNGKTKEGQPKVMPVFQVIG